MADCQMIAQQWQTFSIKDVFVLQFSTHQPKEEMLPVEFSLSS